MKLTAYSAFWRLTNEPTSLEKGEVVTLISAARRWAIASMTIATLPQRPAEAVGREQARALNYAAVHTVRCHMVRLVGEPNAFPFLQHQTQVFRGVD